MRLLSQFPRVRSVGLAELGLLLKVSGIVQIVGRMQFSAVIELIPLRCCVFVFVFFAGCQSQPGGTTPNVVGPASWLDP